MSSVSFSHSYQTMAALDGTQDPEPRRRQPADLSQYPTPRLYSWDQTRRTRGIDPAFRTLADYDFEADGLPLNPDAYLSYEARSKRRSWFIFMLVLCIFPFITPLIYMGKFDDALSWYTKGEVYTLTDWQKRVIPIIMVVQLTALPLIVIYLIWSFTAPVTPSTYKW